MYSPNGCTRRLSLRVRPAPTPGSQTSAELLVVRPSGVAQHRADQDRHADRAGGPVDLGGGVGVAQRVDVARSSPARSPGPAGRLRPAATSAASCSVTRTWLSSTARRWALKSRPRRGTLPCTAAIVDGARRAAPGRGGTSAASGPATQRRAPAGAARHAAQRAPRRAARGAASRRTSSPSASPASTVTNDSSGSPPIAASGSSGPSGWPKPTRPHGSPPNGTRAAQRLARDPHRGRPHRRRGQPGDRAPSRRRPRPTNSASSTTSATHGTGPTRRADPDQQRQQEPQAEQEPVAETRREPDARTRARPSSANAGRASHQSVPRREAQVQQQARRRRPRRARAARRRPRACGVGAARRSGIGGRCGHDGSLRRAFRAPRRPHRRSGGVRAWAAAKQVGVAQRVEHAGRAGSGRNHSQP